MGEVTLEILRGERERCFSGRITPGGENFLLPLLLEEESAILSLILLFVSTFLWKEKEIGDVVVDIVVVVVCYEMIRRVFGEKVEVNYVFLRQRQSSHSFFCRSGAQHNGLLVVMYMPQNYLTLFLCFMPDTRNSTII